MHYSSNSFGLQSSTLIFSITLNEAIRKSDDKTDTEDGGWSAYIRLFARKGLIMDPSGCLYNVKREGPKTDPWCTPKSTAYSGDRILSRTLMECVWLIKYDLGQSRTAPERPNVLLKCLRRIS
ncbi:hypothetical protein PoB_000948500 [Plakobranchus ocellatus]|uniref:Uncharacterized protein n=1 Tax=Plakobranchus ocellatus TaxID=259542 RepID=A0AAV3YJR7_9GAST|nr:hypothetical protein PoB_000948500 [Plakobranchus ocellatus]